MNKNVYQKIVKKHEVKNHRIKNAINALVFGGFMGIIANLIYEIGQKYLSFSEKDAALISTFAIIFITSVLTSLSLYNKISRKAGAGLFIPTSGFANSVVSSALDAQFEGPIYGIGSRMFYLAGSVICYGFAGAFLYALIRLLLSFVGVEM